MAEIFDSSPKIKMVAFYLPQFHAIPENDEAWGEGFTEWTNTKKALPLFKDHYQPREPLNDNYYNLLDIEAIRWQSELAKKYGIFGFCIYHYWFKDGKKLLEKPAELLLENKNIDQPFCFCWANENWSKRWDGGDRSVFVMQDYGGVADWEKHFLYLLPFFQDKRYITMNGNPVFIIYKAEEIPNLEEMLDYLRKRARAEGFQNLAIIFQHPAYMLSNNFDESLFDYYICFEPLYSLQSLQKDHRMRETLKKTLKHILGASAYKKLAGIKTDMNHGPQKHDYDETYEYILKTCCSNSKYITGVFVDWDNTPRNTKGCVFVGGNPQKFGEYLKRVVSIIQNNNAIKLIFITAWNEWGEGANLEPDKKYGYQYLEAVRQAISIEN